MVVWLDRSLHCLAGLVAILSEYKSESLFLGGIESFVVCAFFSKGFGFVHWFREVRFC